MHNFKQLLALLLALVMVFSMMALLSGCSEDDRSDDRENEENNDDDQGNDDVSVEKFDPMVVYEDNGLKLTFHSITTDVNEHHLNFTAENTTSEPLYVQLSSLAINTYRLNDGIEFSLEAEENSEVSIRVNNGALDILNIQKVHCVTVDVCFLNENFFELKLQETVSFELSENQQTFDDAGAEILNKDGVRVVMQGHYFLEDGTLVLSHYVENTSDQSIYLHCTDLLLNGCMPPYAAAFYGELRSGERFAGESYIQDVSLIDITDADDLKNLRGHINVYTLGMSDLLMYEPYELDLEDGSYRFDPQDVTVIFDQDNLQLAYQKTVEMNDTTYFVFFARFNNPNEPSFSVEVSAINGTEYCAYQYSNTSIIADLYLIPMELYLDEYSPCDSLEDIETITISLSYRDAHYEMKTEEVVFELH